MSETPFLRQQIWYDRSSIGKMLCLTGFSLSCLAAMVAFAAAVIALEADDGVCLVRGFEKEVIVLGFNLITTALNESMGYIHAVSLRWALFSDGNLAFNSNLRLLSSSRKSPGNTRSANLVCFLGMVISYSSGPLWLLAQEMFLLQPLDDSTKVFSVAPAGLITYGIGLTMQILVTGLALPAALRAPTFSCSPLDTAAAAQTIASPGRLYHREGRCMMGLDRSLDLAMPTYPAATQRSLFASHKAVRPVLYVAWAGVVGAFVWGGIATAIVHHHGIGITIDNSILVFGQSLDWPSKGITAFNFARIFATLSAAQIPLTLVLHAAELLVNCHRDESTWRAMSRSGSNSKGLRRKSPNPIRAFVSSFSACSLFLLKAVIHTMWSLAMPIIVVSLVMSPFYIFVFAGFVTLLALFVTWLSIARRNGPQPATYGHLQTLVDLIDEWPSDERATMFWGHKSTVKEGVESISHAGVTFIRPLEPIRLDQFYE